MQRSAVPSLSSIPKTARAINMNSGLIQIDVFTSEASGQECVDRVKDGSDAFRREIADGFLYCRDQSTALTNTILEVASTVYSLIRLLADKGLLTIEELDAGKNDIKQRLTEEVKASGTGVMLHAEQLDKYEVESGTQIDCKSRVHLCRAACCQFDFALSRQDVEEGIVKWDLGRPYRIAKAPDGYCSQLDESRCRCTIYKHRPAPCRAYDCRRDRRVWLDFDKMIVNPDLEDVFQPRD